MNEPTPPSDAGLPLRSRGLALLELGRVSNLPTAWSNAFAGMVLASAYLDWVPLLLVLLAVTLLYVGGMAMNDVFDAPIDANQRKTRPIPSGRITRNAAAVFAFGCVSAGVLVAAWMGPEPALVAVGLAVSIALYNLLHTRTIVATVFMGLCRSLIYPLGASAIGADAWSPLLLSVAGAAGVYTVLFTIAARKEDEAGAKPPKGLAWIVPLPGLVPLVLVDWSTMPPLLLVAIGIVAFFAGEHFLRAARNASKGRIMPAVLAWIAGFCLFDALWIVSFTVPWTGLVPLALFGLTTRGHTRILGT